MVLDFNDGDFFRAPLLLMVFDGFPTSEPSPLNIFFFTDGPLTSMVFPNSGTMINNGFVREKDLKKCKIVTYPDNGMVSLKSTRC